MRPVPARFTARARRLPLVLSVRRRLVMLARNSTTLRRAAQLIFAVDSSATAPPDVAPGRVVGGVGTESLPVVLVVVIGADAATLNSVVDETARLQISTAGFRPVIVSDADALAHIRQYGYPAELLISRSEWSGPPSWDEYARERLALLFATYRASAAVTVGADGLDDASRLVLSSLRPTPSRPVSHDR